MVQAGPGRDNVSFRDSSAEISGTMARWCCCRDRSLRCGGSHGGERCSRSSCAAAGSRRTRRRGCFWPHSGFGAYIGPRIEEREGLLRVARYSARAPVAECRGEPARPRGAFTPPRRSPAALSAPPRAGSCHRRRRGGRAARRAAAAGRGARAPGSAVAPGATSFAALATSSGALPRSIRSSRARSTSASAMLAWIARAECAR